MNNSQLSPPPDELVKAAENGQINIVTAILASGVHHTSLSISTQALRATDGVFRSV